MRITEKTILLTIISLVLVLVVGYSFLYYKTKETVNVTVKTKERISYYTNKQFHSKYMVYTETEVFECTDDFFMGKWNSSDVYNQLDAGKSYKVKVIGFRVPFLSMYRNILSVE